MTVPEQIPIPTPGAGRPAACRSSRHAAMAARISPAAGSGRAAEAGDRAGGGERLRRVGRARAGRAEGDHDPVAEIGRDAAAVPRGGANDPLLVLAEELHQRVRVEHAGERREAAEVDEHRGGLAQYALARLDAAVG